MRMSLLILQIKWSLISSLWRDRSSGTRKDNVNMGILGQAKCYTRADHFFIEWIWRIFTDSIILAQGCHVPSITWKYRMLTRLIIEAMNKQMIKWSATLESTRTVSSSPLPSSTSCSTSSPYLDLIHLGVLSCPVIFKHTPASNFCTMQFLLFSVSPTRVQTPQEWGFFLSLLFTII